MNEDATTRLAGMLAADLRAGDAYCLKGDEGAGKTFFRCGIAIAAGVATGLGHSCRPTAPRSCRPTVPVFKSQCLLGSMCGSAAP